MIPNKMVHNNFFSTLRQVEKRLKLENPTTLETNYTESLSTPIYFHTDQEPINNSSSSTFSNEESSEPPLAFLSPLQSSPKSSQFDPKAIKESKTNDTNDIDDIQHLIQLLGLSDIRERNQRHQEEDKVNERVCVGGGGGEYCGCEGGFFEKIVGVKGPKCEKEVERLEGWIRYFLGDADGDGGEERREPLKLAFLLLGKAAFELEGADGGGLDFPSTIEEFLKLDPPENKD